MKAIWKQFRYRLEYFGCRLLAGFIPLLPRRACLILARLSGELYFQLDRRGRAVAMENLRFALGADHGEAARREIARKSFVNFARAMLDLFWARNLTPENYTRYIRLVNFDRLRESQVRDRGIIYISLHAGSHEWVSLTGGFIGLPALMVALDFKNESLNVVFREARERSGNRIITQQQSLLKMFRALKRGGAAGLLADLALRLNQPGQVINAFGMKMYATFLHTLLHSRTGVAMVPVTNVPNQDGTCTVTAHPPLTFPPGTSLQEMTQRCWDALEPIIRERPDLWLWSYKHWRYKPAKADREYPSYSQVSKKFERILGGEASSPALSASPRE